MSEHPITRACAVIAAALDSTVAVDPMYLSASAHRDALVDLTRLGERVESLRMRVIDAATQPGGVVEADGAKSFAAWLNGCARTGYGAPRAAERLGDALATRWRLVAAALEDGRVNLPQAQVIVKVLDTLVTDPLPGEEVPTEVLALAEAHLVAEAAKFGPAHLETLGAKILEVVAPGTADEHERKVLERAERRAQAATKLTLRKRGDGATDVAARIPGAVAARLKTILDAWTSPKQDVGNDHGAATSLGAFAHRDPATGVRLPQERLRGQAFCAFLEAADPTRIPAHGGSATKILITIGLDALRDQLSGGVGTILTNGDELTRISAHDARRLACQAGLVPVVLGSDSVPLDMGYESRFFKHWQREAKILTQHTCGTEGCTVPSTWCEAHHCRDPWAQHGTTDLADLLFLCPFHHHRAHDPTYDLRTLPNGDVRFTRRT